MLNSSANDRIGLAGSGRFESTQSAASVTLTRITRKLSWLVGLLTLALFAGIAGAQQVVATVPVAQQPGAIALDPLTRLVWVTTWANGYPNLPPNVFALKSTTNPYGASVVAQATAGLYPVAIAIDGDAANHRIYTASQQDNSITVIDGNTNAAIATIPGINQPGQIAIDPVRHRVYVTDGRNHTIYIIDGAAGSPTKNTVVAMLNNGAPGPEYIDPIVVDSVARRVYVANYGSATLAVIDADKDKFIAGATAIPVVGFPDDLGLNPVTHHVFVASRASAGLGGIGMVIDPTADPSFTTFQTRTFSVGQNNYVLTVNAALNRVYYGNNFDSTVTVIDAATETSISPVIAVNRGIHGIAVNSQNNRVVVPDDQANTITVIDATNLIVTPADIKVLSAGARPVNVVIDEATNLAFVSNTNGSDVNVVLLSGGGGPPPPGAANYQGIWWAAPATSESGWGINFAHQGDIVFASWFTYDTNGRGWWLVMTAPKTGPNTYSGKLYTTHGPAFNSAVFDPAAVVATEAGTGTLTFTDANNGTFAYTVGAVAQMKTITRQVFGTLPTCAYGTQPNLALATNYQDLWWAKPGGVESGWGINLNHEGDIIFATWFTYDLDGSPLWLVATAPKASPGVYTGDLYRTSGARFDAFDGTKVVPVKVGTATFTFADGNNATFHYDVTGVGPNPVSQSKVITRELFSTAGTTCQ